MSAVLKFESVLATLECAGCCMTFGVPQRFESDRRRDHAKFYCPNGHINYFTGKSDEEKLRDQLAEKERALLWAKNASERHLARAEHAERQLRATRGVVTRTKNRIAKGKCPKCSTRFGDLAKHMAEKHPDYIGLEGEAE